MLRAFACLPYLVLYGCLRLAPPLAGVGGGSFRNTSKFHLVWKKGAMAALEIQKMDAAGVWRFLAIDTEPNYIDTAPLPSADSAEVRKYRAIYMLHDERYGQWSDVTSFTVSGS